MSTSAGLLLTHDVTGLQPVVAAYGTLDDRTAPGLAERLRACRGTRLVLDLSRLTFCDSAGLDELLREAGDSARAGGGLAVVAPPQGAVRRLLDLPGLVGRLDVHDDRAGALTAA